MDGNFLFFFITYVMLNGSYYHNESELNIDFILNLKFCNKE